MKNYTEIENIYQVYQEGIFDRVGARLKGMANTKFLGGSGYNAGKAESFKGKFYDRIIQDIDKFLDEVQTMNGLKSLADFEAKYPEMARKIACMADAVGHKTGLTTQCTKPTTPPPAPSPSPTPSPIPGPVPSPVPSPTPTPAPKELYGYTCNKKTGKCMKVKAVKQEGNSLRSAKGTYLYKTLEACKKKCKKNDGGGSGGSRVTPRDIAQQVINLHLSENGDGDINIGDIIQQLQDQGVLVNQKNVNSAVKTTNKMLPKDKKVKK